MTLWLVRHAPPVLSGQCYGHGEVAVTLRPRAAAREVLPQLPRGGKALTRVLASPSERTASLAEALAKRLRIALELDPRLRELNFGEWEGRSFDALFSEERERFDWWAEEPRFRSPPGGETGEQLMLRVGEFLREWCGAQILVVAHAGSIRALRAVARAQPFLDFSEAVVPLRVEPLPAVEAAGHSSGS